MAATAARTPARWRAPRLLSFLERERLVVAVVAIFATVALAALPALMMQDGWLALVSGRLIAHDGLPHHESLTAWPSGTRWVDQQWMSQLLMYGLHAAGGLRLLLLAHLALVIGGVVVAVAAARRRAAPLTVALVAILAFPTLAVAYLPVRTQSFAVVLFAVVLALLVRDVRAPLRTVWLVLPLLAVWANLHGSVALGAGLVGLRGLTLVAPALRSRRRDELVRGVALSAGAITAVFASPYGAEIPAYYRDTLFNPLFGKVIAEWGPSKPGALTAAFYALLVLAAWTVGRHGHRMTAFEKLVLLATGVSGMLALRNMGWFALAALMILPGTLGPHGGAPREGASRAARLGIVLLPAALLVVVAVVTLARPDRSFDRRFTPQLGAVVARAAADPGARVYAELPFGDWLLWHHPGLAGRVAFDARVELLTAEQLMDLWRFSNQVTDSWRRAIDGYHVIVLEPGSGPSATYRALLRSGGFRVAYVDATAAVLLRTR